MDDSSTIGAGIQQENSGDITLSPFYHSAVNRITQPDRYVFCSQYLIDKWLPDLGTNGLAILLFLRRYCFHNRKTHELRNRIEQAYSVIAGGCDLSISTVRRELTTNDALKKFVRVQKEYRYDQKRKGLTQRENSYTVAMDDPPHPSDMERLQEAVREIQIVAEKGEEDPKERARRQATATLGQNEQAPEYRYPKTERGASILDGGPAKITGEGPKLNSAPCQNDASLIDYSSLPENTKTTLDTPREQPTPPQDTQAVRSFSFKCEEKKEPEPDHVYLSRARRQWVVRDKKPYDAAEVEKIAWELQKEARG